MEFILKIIFVAAKEELVLQILWYDYDLLIQKTTGLYKMLKQNHVTTSASILDQFQLIL